MNEELGGRPIDPDVVGPRLLHWLRTASDEEIIEHALKYAPGLIGCSPEKARAIMARNKRREERRERVRRFTTRLTAPLMRLLS
ncbi:MAG TPA: hypothetical protein VFQ45_06400 [Longimicrobium sp.]|nr:hypothetical protein [Longimicrobium sp.]